MDELVAQRAGQVSSNDRVFVRVASPDSDITEVEITMLVQEYWQKAGDPRFDYSLEDLDARVDEVWNRLDPFLLEP